QVVSTGGLEYLCFGPPESIPIRLRKRKTYMHNPYNANVKVSRSEMAEVGRVMAGRLNTASGPTTVMVPLKGWSVYGAPGGVLHDGTGNRILLTALREHLKKGIQLTEIDAHINDPAFTDACVDQLVSYMEKEPKTP
ncbi:MAG: Tm-1-like ATP-binding domain-containing protein, partial [Proteobacteria bacterium]|nr:Tm-1-like ATP-binding domain-containing protein [Pseudomonadota bacterium]